jgi:hypothetical protein
VAWEAPATAGGRWPDGGRVRDVSELIVLRIGRPVAFERAGQASAGPGADGVEIDAVSGWLTDLQAGDYSPATLRS